MLHYEGAVNDYVKAKAKAGEMLKQPATFKNDPVEKQRLEALVKDPAARSRQPLARSTSACSSMKRASSAKPRLASPSSASCYPQSPLKLDAEIRIGFCQVQLKEYAEAIKTLQPLVEQRPAAGRPGAVLARQGPGRRRSRPRHRTACLSAGPEHRHRHLSPGRRTDHSHPGSRLRRRSSAAATSCSKSPTRSS